MATKPQALPSISYLVFLTFLHFLQSSRRKKWKPGTFCVLSTFWQSSINFSSVLQFCSVQYRLSVFLSTFCLGFVCAPSTLRLGSGDVLPEKFRLCSVYIQEVMFHKICLTMFCLRFHLRSIWVLFMFQRGPKSSQNA